MTTKVKIPSRVRKTATLVDPEIVETDAESLSNDIYVNEDENYANEKIWGSVKEMYTNLFEVIPELIIDELRAFRSQDSTVAWRIGDIANEVYNRAQASPRVKKYTFNDCCYFVSGLCGKNYSTIKGYAITSRRYTEEVRKAFNHADVPFSHFAYAGQKKFEDINIKSGNPFWRDILEYAFNESLATGKDISARELRLKFEGKDYNPKVSGGFKIGGNPSVDGYITPLEVNPISYVSPADQVRVAQLSPDEIRNYVANRLDLILRELIGMRDIIVGNIPSFPSTPFSSAILMLSEVIKYVRK